MPQDETARKVLRDLHANGTEVYERDGKLKASNGVTKEEVELIKKHKLELLKLVTYNEEEVDKLLKKFMFWLRARSSAETVIAVTAENHDRMNEIIKKGRMGSLRMLVRDLAEEYREGGK